MLTLDLLYYPPTHPKKERNGTPIGGNSKGELDDEKEN